MPGLFISYAEQDSSIATGLATELEAAGHKVWMYERDGLPGPTYIEQIVQAIGHVDVVLVIISEKALRSNQVDREITNAFQSGKPIMPVLYSIKFSDLQKQRATWAHMLGAATAVSFSDGGMRILVPRILAGLTALGQTSKVDADRSNQTIERDERWKRGDDSSCHEPVKDGRIDAPSPRRAGQGVSISDFAHDLGMSAVEVLGLARRILAVEFRTPSSLLTESQANTLQEQFRTSTREATSISNSDSTRRLDLGNGAFLELVLVSAGRFKMGSPPEEEGHNDDEVEHFVSITRRFYLSIHPVTQVQFAQVMGFNQSYFQGADLPVEMISWFDALNFCEQLFKRFGRHFRLPTEAEWEYACRAGSSTPFSFGSRITTDNANFDGKFTYAGGPLGATRWKTTPVRSFPPNEWGLYDMHGNIWEWCSDWYGEYKGSEVRDPAGPAQGDIRILRGGSWFNAPADCRSAQRDALDPGRRHSLYGFRIVMSAE